jgi:hypothetical protein
MIRRGRTEGWLKQPIEALPRWATFHGVAFNGVKVGPLPGFEDRGSTVIAQHDLGGGIVEPLLVIPKELIISRQNIELFAKSDRQLHELVESLGDFGRVRHTLIMPVTTKADTHGRRREVPYSHFSFFKRPYAAQRSRMLESLTH